MDKGSMEKDFVYLSENVERYADRSIREILGDSLNQTAIGDPAQSRRLQKRHQVVIHPTSEAQGADIKELKDEVGRLRREKTYNDLRVAQIRKRFQQQQQPQSGGGGGAAGSSDFQLLQQVMEKSVLDHQNHSTIVEQLEKEHRIESQGLQAKVEEVDLERVREQRKAQNLEQIVEELQTSIRKRDEAFNRERNVTELKETELHVKLAKREEEVLKLKRTLADSSAQVKMKDDSIVSLEDRIAKLHADYTKKNRECQELEGEVKEAKQEQRSAENDTLNVEMKLKRLDNERQNREEELHSQLQRKTKQIEFEMESKLRVEKEMKAIQTQKEQLLNKLQQKEQFQHEAQTERSKLQEQIVKLQAQNEHLLQLKEQTEQDLKASKSQLQQQQEHHGSAKLQVEALKRELQQEQERYLKLQKETDSNERIITEQERQLKTLNDRVNREHMSHDEVERHHAREVSQILEEKESHAREVKRMQTELDKQREQVRKAQEELSKTKRNQLSEMSQLHASHTTQLEQSRLEHQQEVTEWKLKFTALEEQSKQHSNQGEKQVYSLRTEKHQLSEKLSTAQNELKQLSTVLEQQQQQHTALEQKIELVNKDKLQLMEDARECKYEMDLCRRTNQRQTEEMDALTQQLKSLHQKHDNSKEELEQMERALRISNEAKTQSDMRQRDLEDQLDSSKASLQVADNARQAAEARVVMLERDTEDIYAKLKRASEQLEEVKNEHMAALTRHQQDMNETQRRFAEESTALRHEHSEMLERARESAERMMADLKHTHMNEQTTLKTALLEAHATQLQQQEQDHLRKTDEAQRQMRTNIHELEQKHQLSLQAQRSGYEDKASKAKSAYTDSLRETEYLLKDEKRAREAAVHDAEKLEQALEQARKEAKQTQDQLNQELEKVRATARKDAKASDHRELELQKTLDQSLMEHQEQRKQLEALETALSHAEEKHLSIQKQMIKANNDHNTKLAKLKEEAEARLQKIRKREQEVKLSLEQTETARKELSVLYDEMEQNYTRQQAHVSELTAKIEHLHEEQEEQQLLHVKEVKQLKSALAVMEEDKTEQELNFKESYTELYEDYKQQVNHLQLAHQQIIDHKSTVEQLTLAKTTLENEFAECRDLLKIEEKKKLQMQKEKNDAETLKIQECAELKAKLTSAEFQVSELKTTNTRLGEEIGDWKVTHKAQKAKAKQQEQDWQQQQQHQQQQQQQVLDEMQMQLAQEQQQLLRANTHQQHTQQRLSHTLKSFAEFPAHLAHVFEEIQRLQLTDIHFTHPLLKAPCNIGREEWRGFWKCVTTAFQARMTPEACDSMALFVSCPEQKSNDPQSFVLCMKQKLDWQQQNDSATKTQEDLWFDIGFSSSSSSSSSETIRFAAGEGIVGACAASGHITNVQNSAQDGRFMANLDAWWLPQSKFYTQHGIDPTAMPSSQPLQYSVSCIPINLQLQEGPDAPKQTVAVVQCIRRLPQSVRTPKLSLSSSASGGSEEEADEKVEAKHGEAMPTETNLLMQLSGFFTHTSSMISGLLKHHCEAERKLWRHRQLAQVLEEKKEAHAGTEQKLRETQEVLAHARAVCRLYQVCTSGLHTVESMLLAMNTCIPRILSADTCNVFLLDFEEEALFTVSKRASEQASSAEEDVYMAGSDKEKKFSVSLLEEHKGGLLGQVLKSGQAYNGSLENGISDPFFPSQGQVMIVPLIRHASSPSAGTSVSEGLDEVLVASDEKASIVDAVASIEPEPLARESSAAKVIGVIAVTRGSLSSDDSKDSFTSDSIALLSSLSPSIVEPLSRLQHAMHLQHTMQEQRVQLKHLHESMAAVLEQKAEIQQELSELQGDSLQRLKREQNNFKTQLAEVASKMDQRHSNTEAKYQAQVALLQQENEELSNSLTELQVKHREAQSVWVQQQQLQETESKAAHNATLQKLKTFHASSLAQLREEYESKMQEEYARAGKRCDEIAQRANQMEEKATDMLQGFHDCKQELQRTLSSLEHAQQDTEDWKARANEHQARHMELQEMRSAWEGKQDVLQQTNRELQHRCEEFESVITEYESTTTRMQEVILKLQSQHNASQAEVAKLKSILKSVRTELKEVLTREKERLQRGQQLTNEVMQLEAAITHHKKNNIVLSNTVQRLMKDNEHAKASIEIERKVIDQERKDLYQSFRNEHANRSRRGDSSALNDVSSISTASNYDLLVDAAYSDYISKTNI